MSKKKRAPYLTQDKYHVLFLHHLVDYNDRKMSVCFLWEKSTGEFYSFGIARCSNKDIFSKKIGRLISYGRAKSVATCFGYFDIETARRWLNKFDSNYILKENINTGKESEKNKKSS